MLRFTTAAVLAALVLAPSALASGSAWNEEANAARTALGRSVDAGYITPEERGEYLGIIGRATSVAARIPSGRADVLESVLAQVAKPKSPTGPRALTLYSTLDENATYLATHALPADGSDLAAGDGVVYRMFAGQGLQFHPLANAAELNALVAANDTDAAHALVDALAARAIPQPDGSAVWEYEFDYDGEHAPWTSGFAQAVLAQALARAGDVDLAREAFAAVPGKLDLSFAAGPWIRLYSQSRVAVLNAQLQAAISIGDYAQIAQDGAAAAYANRMLAAAKAMLPRFDTGHWSRYSLGTESDLHYQDYVIDLLKTLAGRTRDTTWLDEANRLLLYETQPPLMTGADVSRRLVPRPRDGVRDDLVVRFYLSKISKVALVVDGKAVDGFLWQGGWHTFRWFGGKLAPGTHEVRLVASDLAGNAGSADLGSFEVVRDTSPPALAAAKGSGRVFWRASDAESACCRIEVQLTRAGARRTIAATGGRSSVRVPAGYWSVTVVAADAAGNTARRPLGLVVGRAD